MSDAPTPAAPSPADRLTDAEREAALARNRVTDTLAVLQHRLDPRKVARETMRDASDRGTALAQASVDTARRHPGALTGVAAGLAAFVIGRPIVRLIRNRRETRRLAKLQVSPPAPHQGSDR